MAFAYMDVAQPLVRANRLAASQRGSPSETKRLGGCRRVDEMIIAAHRRWRHLRRVDPIIPHQMKNLAACCQKIVGDDPAMAAPPYGFGAHDSAATPKAQIHECGKSPPIFFAQGVIRIIMEAAILPKRVDGIGNGFRFGTTTTEFRQLTVPDLMI